MKKSWKPASACRFTFVLLLVLATTALLVSVSNADEPAAQKSGQTVVKPLPAAPAKNSVVAQKQLPPTPNEAVQATAQKSAKPVGAKPVAAKPAQPATPVAQKPPAVPPKPNGAIQATAQKSEKPAAAKPFAAKPAAANPVKALTSAPKPPAPPAVQRASTPDAVKVLQNFLGKKSAEQPKETPEELSAIAKRTSALLATPKFSFIPDKALDPFVPFISLQPANVNAAPGSVPLTPLQRMTMAEMERGLKAIVWGSLGRMAVIEDSTGKGFIVGVGTPAGPNAGVITRVQDDQLVIQQEIWNSKTKKRTPENFTIKLVKKDNHASF